MPVFVYIIESLRPEDIRNCNNLALGQVLGKTLEFMGFDVKYIPIESKMDFLDAMTLTLYQMILSKEAFPILHFIMHGSKDGIQLSNDESITWTYLREILFSLKDIIGNNLMICMCTCYGFLAFKMAMRLDKRGTFDILIGNDSELGFNQGLIAYQTFYHHLLNDSTIEGSVEAMKTASKDNNFKCITGIDAKQIYLDDIIKQSYEQAAIRIQQEKNKMYFLSDFSNQ